MYRRLFCLLSLITASGLVLAVRADVINYSATSPADVNSILNDGSQGTTFDTLSLAGQSGSFSVTPFVGETINRTISVVTFTEGVSCATAVNCEFQNGTSTFSVTLN